MARNPILTHRFYQIGLAHPYRLALRRRCKAPVLRNRRSVDQPKGYRIGARHECPKTASPTTRHCERSTFNSSWHKRNRSGSGFTSRTMSPSITTAAGLKESAFKDASISERFLEVAMPCAIFDSFRNAIKARAPGSVAQSGASSRNSDVCCSSSFLAGVLLEQSGEMLCEASDRAIETATDISKSLVSYTKKNPITALLLVLGAGALLVSAAKSIRSQR
jgi:hypothetical protein